MSSNFIIEASVLKPKCNEAQVETTHIQSHLICNYSVDKLKSIDQIKESEKSKRKTKKDTLHLALVTEIDLHLCLLPNAVFILQTNEAFNQI